MKDTSSPAMLNEQQLIKILLVRAIEENDSSYFSDKLLEANIAASDATDRIEFIAKRNSWLSKYLPREIWGLARIVHLPEYLMMPCFVIAFFVGMFSNYLGPSGFIHVAYNPITFLLVWSIVVYFTLLYNGLKRSKPGDNILERPSVNTQNSSKPAVKELKSRRSLKNVLGKLVLGKIFSIVIKNKLWFSSFRSKVKNTRKVATSYWENLWDSEKSLMLMRFTSLVHFSAIGLLIGALVGIYIRGLFFEYNAVWRSTFLTNTESITDFLNLLLGLSSILIDGKLINPEHVEPLLSNNGVLAGPWIHKLSLMAVIVVLIPRSLFLAFSIIKRKRESKSLTIDISEPYYIDTVFSSIINQDDNTGEKIKNILKDECRIYSENIANYICDGYFDTFVVQAINNFKKTGGKLIKLENEIKKSWSDFNPKLLKYLDEQRLILQSKIESKIGSEMFVSSANFNGNTINDIIRTAIEEYTDSFAIMGGLSAIIMAILTGAGGVFAPIMGILIYILGRRPLEKFIKRRNISASTAVEVLDDSMIHSTRKSVFSDIKNEIDGKFDILINDVTGELLKKLSKLARFNKS